MYWCVEVHVGVFKRALNDFILQFVTNIFACFLYFYGLFLTAENIVAENMILWLTSSGTEVV